MADPRVPLLRERLGLAAEPNTNYNAALAMAVGKLQKANGIQVTGQLNGPTIEAINGPSRVKKLDAVLATMERWRWMPRDLGKTHVELNIPDYFVRVFNNGEKVWQTQRQGLKMERAADGKIRVFQPPGERNALGQIRFNFPNKFLVYQHDTPEKGYFDHDKRAYSHGCQRVQNPLKYAEVLLSYASPKANYTAEGIKRMLGGEEKQLDFKNQIPVHLTYQTAFVDENGKLQFREDIYGLDAKIASILHGSERQVADVAVERPADPNFKPTAEQNARLKALAGGGPSNPFALFGRVFR
jgi:murein L,D-transpeptidase YcbB/YkuD